MAYRPFLTLAALFGAVALGGCAGPGDGNLDAQPGNPYPSCRVHQLQPPGSRYTSGAQADPRSVLEMLHYYTVNGRKPFCDGKAPTDFDDRWAGLYVKLGGRPDHVTLRQDGVGRVAGPSRAGTDHL
ncbi:hypothetical protein POF50_015630 [Streptomyces sp. SL13]|uniref:Lipoprotein n=1 Tax=Streptantibioticus silvisoli TaxID=2705255 RepID=A0AA90K967_9ACTN|nr:hypothetical protein [Streptantibioticus silvisoli]MDI5970753.1 hypothetical protein [Streptantibioticus silvisoli]